MAGFNHNRKRKLIVHMFNATDGWWFKHYPLPHSQWQQQLVSANIVAAKDYKIQAKKQPKIHVLLRVEWQWKRWKKKNVICR